MTKLSFFHYNQNNSGGVWDGPAKHVIVQAASADEANRRAETVGVYFNGCDDGQDCPCCGDRWSPAWGDGDPEPSVYGAPVAEGAETLGSFLWANDDGRPLALVVYSDGSEVRWVERGDKWAKAEGK